jgi:hypothetical protein
MMLEPVEWALLAILAVGVAFPFVLFLVVYLRGDKPSEPGGG